MARGNLAKENIAKKIAQTFGADFIGEFDKKLYIWSEENGEKIQIAITMTCPKNPVGDINFSAEPGNSLNFEDMSAGPVIGSNDSVEITEDEKRNIAELMSRLGL